MPDYGLNVSRTLPVRDTGYTGTVHLKLKPSVDAEHNLDTDLADFNSASRLKQLLYSGITNFKAANREELFIPTLDQNFIANDGQNPNEFGIQNFDAVVNGWVIPVRSSAVTGGSMSDMDYVSIELPVSPAPAPMSRQDFVFLEVWRSLIKPSPSTENKPSANQVYRYGNTQYRGVNLQDDLTQPDINATTSYRVQVQYRIRVVEGVDFSSHPEGLTDTIVKARGGASSASTWTYQRDLEDKGLFVAGDGSSQAQSDLGNVDGYVYAIPLCKVHRRNSAAYSMTNPNGSSSSLLNSPMSDRPDGLFYDEVALRDIIDLRHLVNPDMDMSGLLEHNFDLLLRRNLNTEYGSDPSIDSQIQGTEMLTVDGYSVADQSGVYDLPFDPDNLRRDYSGESREHQIMFSFEASQSLTEGAVIYNAVNFQISVSLPPGSTLTAPLIYVDGDLKNDGMQAPGWTVTGNVATGILNSAYSSNTVVLIFDASYAPAGHRFVATNYFNVRNARALNPEDFSFTVNPSTVSEYRNVPQSGLPVTLGIADTIRDYPIVTIDNAGDTQYQTPVQYGLHYNAFTRLYERNITGNGTNIYTVPSSVNGINVLGIRSVQVTDSNVILWNTITPTSVVRNTNGNFTVTLPNAYLSTFVIKFELVLEKTGTVLDRSTKGLKEIQYLEWLTSTGDGVSSSYTFYTSGLPYAMSSFDNSGTPAFFAYVAGVRSFNITNIDISVNRVQLTFNSPVASGEEIRFYMLVSYAPTPLDRLQVVYDRRAYQGTGAANVNLPGAKIMAVGKNPVVHTLGTFKDTDLRNKEMFAISETLPLAFGSMDSDFENTDLGLANSQFSAFKMLKLPWGLTHDYRAGSTGKLPAPGDIILTDPRSVTPERGISDLALYIKNRLDDVDYPLEFVTPLLNLAGSHQVVMYYLIKDPETHELLLLVITYSSSGIGNELVKSDATQSGVAYDVYRLSGKPILK